MKDKIETVSITDTIAKTIDELKRHYQSKYCDCSSNKTVELIVDLTLVLKTLEKVCKKE
jgi:hypothetical protein